MQLAISQVNDICERLLDNIQLETLVPPLPSPAELPPLYSAKGVKNTRRHMEDRHIILDDFNAVFGIEASYPLYIGTSPRSMTATQLARMAVTQIIIIASCSHFFGTQNEQNKTEKRNPIALLFIYSLSLISLLFVYLFIFFLFHLLCLSYVVCIDVMRTDVGANELLCHIRWSWWHRCGCIFGSAHALRNRGQPALSRAAGTGIARCLHHAGRQIHREIEEIGEWNDRQWPKSLHILAQFEYLMRFFWHFSLVQRMVAGTTALCVLHRPTEQRLHVAWVGDSKAMLVSENRVLQIVTPHKPSSEVRATAVEVIWTNRASKADCGREEWAWTRGVLPWCGSWLSGGTHSRSTNHWPTVVCAFAKQKISCLRWNFLLFRYDLSIYSNFKFSLLASRSKNASKTVAAVWWSSLDVIVSTADWRCHAPSATMDSKRLSAVFRMS